MEQEQPAEKKTPARDQPVGTSERDFKEFEQRRQKEQSQADVGENRRQDHE
jgi:hypothetical protein